MQDPLITASRLASERDDWVIVECSTGTDVQPGLSSRQSAGFARFLTEGHVPGARYADIGIDLSDPRGRFAFARPDAGPFEQAARRLGISRTDRVAVYDRSNGIWAARFWWLLRAFGHDAVAVVDGGLEQWRQAGLPLEFEERSFASGDFAARERQGYFVDKAFVADVVAGTSFARLVNVLRRPVFSGEEQTYARHGHIPGSVNIPYKELIDPATNRLADPEQLKARFGDVGESNELVVTYCGGGITAAGGALALAVLGRRNVAIYDGSLNEWAADARLPLVTGS